jgi:hypothetical protein
MKFFVTKLFFALRSLLHALFSPKSIFSAQISQTANDGKIFQHGGCRRQYREIVPINLR